MTEIVIMSFGCFVVGLTCDCIGYKALFEEQSKLLERLLDLYEKLKKESK